MENKEEFKELESDDGLNIPIKYFDASSKIVTHRQHAAIQVSYRQTDELQNGRYFAIGAIGLQGMYGIIRQTISNEYYRDLDMVNAHPTIIQWFCLNLCIPCEYLSEFIKDRDTIVNALIKINKGISKGEVKKIILSIIYGGSSGYASIKKTKWLMAFNKEFKHIRKFMCKAFPTFYESRKKVKDTNIEGSTLSFIANFVENQLLQHTLLYFKENLTEKEYLATVLVFDGLMVRNTVSLTDMDIHIDTLNNMFNDMGIPIKFMIKEMKSLVLANFQRNGIYNFDDGYYWYDFITGLTRKTWGTSDLESYIRVNINRVVIRLCTGEYFLKTDKDKPFEDVKTLPQDLISVNSIKKGKKDEVITMITPFNKLISSKYFNLINNYNGLVFNPSGISDDRNFNTWSGFKAKLLSNPSIQDYNSIQKILDHIKIVWANNDEKIYHYILSWLHQIFRYPENKTKVVMVLRSAKQQIGKGILVEGFLRKYVFGYNTSIYGPGLSFLVNKFNAHLVGKVFACADELSTLDNSFHGTYDIIKSLITGDQLSIEIKGGRKFNINNYINLLFLTNNEFTVKVESDDARYAVFDCNNCYAGDSNYFSELGSLLTQDNADRFYTYIYNLVDPCNIRAIPETQLKRDMKLSCMSSPKKFLHHLTENFETSLNKFFGVEINQNDENKKIYNLNTQSLTIKASEFYVFYTKFCLEQNEKIMSQTLFGREIKDHINKKRTATCYVYDLNTLKSL